MIKQMGHAIMHQWCTNYSPRAYTNDEYPSCKACKKFDTCDIVDKDWKVTSRKVMKL